LRFRIKWTECGHKISDPEKNVRQSIKNIKFSLNQKSIVFEKVIKHSYGFGYCLNDENMAFKNRPKT